MPDLDEINPHLALAASESYESPNDKAWSRWVDKVEAILGHSLDGNNSAAARAAGTADGYSLDEAHDAFMAGDTPEQYAAEVRGERVAMLAPCDDDPNNASDCAHEWAYTGTAYGGDDESYFGEGRCYCVHCGADGDA